MAKTVFFCPKACAGAIGSPMRSPTRRPRANCAVQVMSAANPMPKSTDKEASVCTKA